MAKDFNERLARLADQVATLSGGEELARALLRLAGDIDMHLEQGRVTHYERATALFQKWNEFMNESVKSAYREGDERLVEERKKTALRLAADARWSGGYAGALKLMGVE